MVCVTKLCVCVCDRWCVTKLCVTEGRGRRRRDTESKQEPHTKMWGISKNAILYVYIYILYYINIPYLLFFIHSFIYVFICKSLVFTCGASCYSVSFPPTDAEFVYLPTPFIEFQHPTALSFMSTPADSKTFCLDMNSFRNPKGR